MRVTENAAGCGFDSHLKKLNIKYFHAFTLWHQGKSPALSSTITRIASKKSAESGEVVS